MAALGHTAKGGGGASGPRVWLPCPAWLLLSATLAATLLVGCGFHLRGAVEIPPELNPLYIQAAPGSPVQRAIEDQLTGSAVKLAAGPGPAKLILRILSETRFSRVAAVDSSGKVLAYELHYLVHFDAVGKDGKERMPPQTLDLVRTFDNPDVEVLGKQLEEELIFQDFATDAADRILMRLRAVLA
ncbi:MAG: LPS assembly lipoprotein LptE [Bdellovibrio bacteriovorus]